MSEAEDIVFSRQRQRQADLDTKRSIAARKVQEEVTQLVPQATASLKARSYPECIRDEREFPPYSVECHTLSVQGKERVGWELFWTLHGVADRRDGLYLLADGQLVDAQGGQGSTLHDLYTYLYQSGPVVHERIIKSLRLIISSA